MITREAIQARRDALALQLERGKRRYEELEQALRDLDRDLVGMYGAIQALDELLAESEELVEP